MTRDPVGDFFRLFARSAERLETRPFYGPDAEAFAVHQAGLPPTEAYLSRRAEWRGKVTATTSGSMARTVGRVLVVETPLNDYWRWRLDGLAGAAAAGERIRLADRTWHPELARLTTDCWLFDRNTEQEWALWMRYADDGAYLGRIPATDPAAFTRCREDLQLAASLAVELHEFLTGANG